MKLQPRYLMMIAVVLIALSQVKAVHGDLVVLDLNTPGDGLLTLDTSTGLEWLDVTQSIGMSYNDADIAFPTFRHATKTEIQGFVVEFGITTGVGHTSGNFAPSQNMLNTTGFVISSGNTPFQQAFYDTGATSTTELSLVQLNLSDSTGLARLPQSANILKTTSFGVVANYMVRTSSVPEPTTFAMFGIAMTALGFRRRRV